MGKIYSDNSQSIGNTPPVKLNHIVGDSKATILAKVGTGCAAVNIY